MKWSGVADKAPTDIPKGPVKINFNESFLLITASNEIPIGIPVTLIEPSIERFGVISVNVNNFSIAISLILFVN